MYENPQMYTKLRYRHLRRHDPDKLEDVFDGLHFQQLRSQPVAWAGRTTDRTYFQDEHELALGLGTDSVPLFERKPLSCWPLVLINYSLPPELRTRKEFQICCGIIPGQRLPKRKLQPGDD